MLGEFREKGLHLSIELGDAFRVRLLDRHGDVELLDAGQHLFVVRRRVDQDCASVGGSPERAVFARRPDDVLGVGDHGLAVGDDVDRAAAASTASARVKSINGCSTATTATATSATSGSGHSVYSGD